MVLWRALQDVKEGLGEELSMEGTGKYYLDMSDSSLFQGWNGLEHSKTYPMFRWSTDSSRIYVRDYGDAWCALRISSGSNINPHFEILLNGTVKVCEGKAEPVAREFSFFVPKGIDFLQIVTQGWRPCDLSSSKDGRLLGIGLSEVMFQGLTSPESITKRQKASSIEQKLREKLTGREGADVISFCRKMVEGAATSYERVLLVYGVLLYLLETFPKTKLSLLDEKGELKALFLGIDMPCFDIDGEIYKGFAKNAHAFENSSMEVGTKENWRKNTAVLKEKALGNWILEEPELRIFTYDENVSFLFKDGHVYVNHVEAAFWEKLYFEKLSSADEALQNLLYMTARAVLEKEFCRLKSLVEAPWVPRDEILRQQIRHFRHNYPHSEKYDYLMGRFYQGKQDYKRARRYVFLGLRRRRLDYHLCELMGDLCKAMGEYPEAAGYYGRMLAKKAERGRQWMVLDNNELNADKRTQKRIAEVLRLAEKKSPEILNRCIEEVGSVLITERAKYGDHQKLLFEDGKFSIVNFKDGEIHGVKSGQDIFYKGIQNPGSLFWKGDCAESYQTTFERETILPLMTIEKDNVLEINYQGKTVHYDGKKSVNRFRPNNWQFLRLQGHFHLQAEKKITVGKPVALNPAFSRKKLVINLLVDALSMEEVQADLARYMPCTYRFFSKGTIFKYAYGISDWTHPCTSSMFYGLNLRRNQLFHARVNLEQLPGYRNVAEHLHEKGYLCINSFFDVERFLANDAYRGYDMHKSYGVNDGLAIMDAISLLEAMPTNIFLNMHFMEVHQAGFCDHESWTLEIDTLDLPFGQVMKSDMLVSGNTELENEEKREGRYNVYLHEIAQTDRKLGMLYDYLAKNYGEEEYIIVLHSDHGGGRTNINTRHHSHTCLMVRGDGVPHRGIVDDEVVSALDWFAIFEHFCEFKTKLPRDSSLPKVFGGPGREYAVTQRLYPNQKYALSLNDLEYEFYLQTAKETTYDGKIDLSDIECHLYHHIDGKREEVFDQSLLDKYFSLAYEEAKYFDEPDENAHDNLFDRLLTEKRLKHKPLVSLVLDAREEKEWASLIHSLSQQSFKDFELLAIVEESREADFMEQYGSYLEGVLMIRVLSVRGSISLHDVLKELHGEYVLFLSGEEILAQSALEAFYHTAREYKAEVVENTWVFEKEAGAGHFLEDIYQEWLHPLDGSAPIWQPEEMEGRVSSRSELWLKEGKRIYSSWFLIRKDFLLKFNGVEMPTCGFDELLAMYLIFGASHYVRISVPLCSYAPVSAQRKPDLCLEALLKNMDKVETLLKGIPFLADKTQLQDALREKFFNAFEEHYLIEAEPMLIEEAITKALRKHPTVSSWLVRYLFSRAIVK